MATKRKERKPMELKVSNFGPIVRAKIDLRPLTVFVGPSNTGKSYLAILIYALHRFFRDFPLGARRYIPRRTRGMHGPSEGIQQIREWAKSALRGRGAAILNEQVHVPAEVAHFIKVIALVASILLIGGLACTSAPTPTVHPPIATPKMVPTSTPTITYSDVQLEARAKIEDLATSCDEWYGQGQLPVDFDLEYCGERIGLLMPYSINELCHRGEFTAQMTIEALNRHSDGRAALWDFIMFTDHLHYWAPAQGEMLEYWAFQMCNSYESIWLQAPPKKPSSH